MHLSEPNATALVMVLLAHSRCDSRGREGLIYFIQKIFHVSFVLSLSRLNTFANTPPEYPLFVLPDKRSPMTYQKFSLTRPTALIYILKGPISNSKKP